MSDEQQRLQKQEELYHKLSEQYTPEELAEYFVFPSALMKDEQEEVNAEFRKLRMERLRSMTSEEVMFGNLLRMKYRIQNYLKGSDYAVEYSFSSQLREYLQITRRTQAELAAELNIDKTKFSKLINGKIKPSINVCIRLQKHSDEILPAKLWYKLYLKTLETAFEADPTLKEAEYKEVKSSLSLGLTG